MLFDPLVIYLSFSVALTFDVQQGCADRSKSTVNNESVARDLSKAFDVDPEEIGGNFEGDMILNDEQLDYINGFSERNGLTNLMRRWNNNTVPYVVDYDKFDDSQTCQILKAIEILRCVSCLVFRPKRKTDVDYILITDSGKGCNSAVGRIGGKQILNLQADKIDEGCFRLGSILHEFLHALGFIHMQNVHNRDKYVDIVWDHVKRAYHDNFRSYSFKDANSFGLPYDYDSVMHYSSRAFSHDGSITIKAKRNQTIGQRDGLSSSDVMKLNIMYNCL